MKSNDAELASQGRRLAGAVLDGFLFVLTLGIGWVIWYLIVAREADRAQRSNSCVRALSVAMVNRPTWVGC